MEISWWTATLRLYGTVFLSFGFPGIAGLNWTLWDLTEK
jgi:hypothetical protein